MSEIELFWIKVKELICLRLIQIKQIVEIHKLLL